MKAQVNGIELYYDAHGSGQPVLFIHGFPLSGRMWKDLVDPLRGRYRLIVPDLRGFGRSQVTAEASMAVCAEDLAGLLDALGEAGPAVIVGLSMGGYIAFEFFRRHRGRVRGLVLADTRAEPDTPEAARDREQSAQRVLSAGCAELADSMADKLFATDAPAALKSTWRGIMRATSPAGAAAALRAMARRADSRPTLASIDVPTLVVVGETDVLTPPSTARSIHQGVAGSRLEIIAGAGHMPPVEQPARFAAVLRAFLDSLT